MFKYILANQELINDKKEEIAEWSGDFLELLDCYNFCHNVEVWFNFQDGIVENYLIYQFGILVASDSKKRIKALYKVNAINII